MALGERIGDAYVRIHADGRGLDREIRDQWEDLDPVMRSVGKKHATTYDDAFAKEMEKRGPLKPWIKIAADMNRATGRLDAGSEWIKQWDARLEALREKINKDFGANIGDRLTARIRDGMQRGFIRTQKQFDAFVSDLRPHIVSITKEIDSENDRLLKQMIRAQEQFLKAEERNDAESSAEILEGRRKDNLSIIGQFQERIKREADLLAEEQRREREAAEAEKRLLKDVSDFRNRMWAQRTKEADASFKALQASFERLAKGEREFGESVEETQRELQIFTEHTRDLRQENERTTEGVGRLRRALGRFIPTLRTVRKENDEMTDTLRQMRVGLALMTPRLDRINRKWGDFANVLGRATGRGSRNNFLNFVGSVNRNLALLSRGIVVGPVRGFQKLLNIMDEVRQGAFKVSDFKEVVGGLAKQAAGGIASLAGFAAMIALVATVAGIATAAVSGLVAILTALASSVIFAAIGALAPLVGLLGPIAAGIGAVILGVKELKKDASGLNKEGLEPLKKSFEDLREGIRKTFVEGINRNIGTLKAAFVNLAPLVTAGADGVVRAAEGIARSFADPRFKVFSDTMSRFIPKALDSLGRSIGNLNLALAGIFRALIPITREFLGWLEKITAEFADWTNSRRGQREIREFLRDAADSAKAVGRFLGVVVELLAQVIDQARSTGDTIFDDMSNALEDVITWLKDPEGKKAMADWLQWAEDFSRDLGDLIVAVAKLIDTLDSPQNRKFASDLIDLFGKIVGLLSTMSDLSDQFGLKLGPIGLLVSRIKEAFGRVKEVVLGVDDAMGDLVDGISALTRSLRSSNFGRAFVTVLSPARAVQRLVQTITDMIRTAPVFSNLFRRLTPVAEAFVNTLRSIRTGISSMPTVGDLFRAVQRAANTFVQVLGNIKNAITKMPSVGDLFGAAISAARVLLDWINRIINSLSNISVHINWPSPPSWLNDIGGGGGGRNPLNPLGGLLPRSSVGDFLGGAVPSSLPTPVSTGRQVTIPSITVVSNADDPKAVARELLNQITATAY